MNADTAALLATATARGNRQSALVAAIEYGATRRLIGLMGDRRVEVIAEDGARTVLGAETSTGRFYIENAAGGVARPDMYLSGTAALMARDVFAATHTA